jgi:hypothetical protein
MATEPYGVNYNRLTPAQLAGSEYGGVAETRNTVQPKGRGDLTNGELLRLGYLTGDTTDSLQQTVLSLEDHRQMLGLKPAGDSRPTWLANASARSTWAEIEGAVYPENMVDDPYIPGGY